jgi:urea transport system permease protein
MSMSKSNPHAASLPPAVIQPELAAAKLGTLARVAMGRVAMGRAAMGRVALLGKLPRDSLAFALTALLLLVVFPLSLSGFRLGMVSKYLTYAFPAIALVVCWGKGGILSLGQGVFFGLGGYCMAMFLKLEASDRQSTSIQSTPGIPDFMDWNQLTELPFFWVPFNSLPFTLLAVVAVPGLLALGISLAMFKRRVGGVYFAIITQAIASVLTILIIGQQGYTGGVNGITDLKTLGGWDIRTDSAKLILYYVNASLLLGTVLLSTWILRSKLGRLLVAMREKEERVRFTGYDVASLKVFAFVFAAVVSAIGGAMFALVVGFMSPSFVGIVPSIEMVIAAAVGGRHSLLGAIYGSLLVNYGKTFFSESFPELWLFLLGGLFILVVMAFPNGLAGLDVRRWLEKVRLEKLSARLKALDPAAAPRAASPVQPRGGVQP